MNLIITDVCNRSCPYCFARAKVDVGRGVGPAARHMSMEAFERCLSVLGAGQCGEPLKLLGGEPSLHPLFTQFVTLGLDRKFEVTVFSNGLWSANARERFVPVLQHQNLNRLTFVINVNEPSLETGHEAEPLAGTLQMLGGRAQPGFNIYRQQFDMRFIVDTVKKHGLRRRVRVGLAAPIVGTENGYVRREWLRGIAARIVEQAQLLEQHDILMNFDCGFPLCMFSEDQIGKLALTSGGVNSECGCPIDVGPDLTVWPCFPLSNVLNVKLGDFRSTTEIRQFYNSRLSVFRRMGTMDECASCKYARRGQCCGGCVAHTLRTWSDNGDPRVLEKLSRVRPAGSPSLATVA